MLNLEGKTVVIVDDDLPSLRYYETVLKSTGCNIINFKNGRDFVAFLSTPDIKIDIVFMDYLIPFINGVDCIRLLRKEDRTVPVIMLTAYFSDQARNDAFIAGCTEYILKPVFPEKLVQILDKYLIPDHTKVTSLF